MAVCILFTTGFMTPITTAAEASGSRTASEAAVTQPQDQASAESSDAAVQLETTQASYPAQNFSGSAGGVSVSVSAPEGAFPKGTTMSVSAVSDSKAKSIAEKAAGSETEV